MRKPAEQCPVFVQAANRLRPAGRYRGIHQQAIYIMLHQLGDSPETTPDDRHTGGDQTQDATSASPLR